MISIKKFTILTLLLGFMSVFGQQKPEVKKISITGKIIEKSSSLPLEYATVTLSASATNKVVSGGITNSKGEFKIDINPGTYNIKYEYISFKTIEIKGKNLSEDTNVGTISLADEAQQLDAVEIRVEKTSVDIKLDKKVYSVGKDIMVRGGTVSDVLDNIPSVTVDAEGSVALRGNENVRILIDGKPSNAGNINDALRLIPAEAIDKVEVVTNPSARYDAEGGGGILNIILKKGKNQGINGTFVASAGDPRNTGLSANLNFKQENSNFFTTIGYNNRNNPGNNKIDQENFNPDGSLRSVLNERRKNERFGEGLNVNFGVELLLDKSTSWTNSLNFRNNNGGNKENVLYYNYDNNRQYINTRQRYNDLVSESENVEFSSNFVKNFKKDGHKLTIDASFSLNRDDDFSKIEGTIIDDGSFVSSETAKNINKQNRNLFQTDYVLPIGKNSQFEAGFRGNYVSLLADYQVQEKKTPDDYFTNIDEFTNKLEYKENVNAFYSQFGSKINKFSYLLGLRFEDSKIDVNQLTTNIYKTKKYNNLFPSVFLTYEFSQNSSISLNYSKRISRPRDRFINPFASYTSNVNLYQGNPDLNPALSDAFDLGYLRKWEKLTLNTSLYFNHTTDSFETVKKERGDEIDGIPVIISTPFNLGKNDRLGFEFTLNYNFKKWWKLNGNFNFFNSKNSGSYTYTKTNNEVVTQNFDRNASSWFTRITSKVTLPYKIEWQTNGTYNGPQKTGQGTNKGVAAANLAFSKDILKDMGTISLNVNDVFNSRKRIQEIQLPTVNTYSESQWRTRLITVSFTYRFNKKKTEKDTKQKQQNDNNGDPEFMG
ncbi:outer membrane beta-barrel family protein [Flavobacterium humi]|uniref:TonB-dependent receptor n=1 Tax=Flavobacterium humi TaxID=2562683 RepID=A0A4Z0LD26_9FLAO|nr:outer membrane beta-barrel family protein [Flavobacterium humi]TGD59777.1 TonB-dependent receptor [Flavobacterium humi]